MSKLIPLTKLRFAIVDDEDVAMVGQYKWCFSHGYAMRKDENGKTQYMHRLIMGTPESFVDHKNMDGLDNRRVNLRLCDKSGNMNNRKLQSNNKSGYKGVHWCNTSSRWVASIKINGKRKTLGYFTDLQLAALKRRKAAQQYYGEFARE